MIPQQQPQQPQPVTSAPMDIHSLLGKLLNAGLIANKKKEDEETQEADSNDCQKPVSYLS